MLVGVGGLGLVSCLHHMRVPWVWHLMDEVPSKLCAMYYLVQPALAREFSRQFRGTYLACSQQLVDSIERQGVMLGDRVELLPNWVTGPRPKPRGSYHDGGRLRIVAAATFLDRNYDKGADLLIHSAALLRERGLHEFALDVYGKVTDSSFADLIQSLGLSGHVTLKGSLAQAQLMEAYQDYDVFAFPGRTDEPFGFAPLEAMTRGCVPVLNRTCGASEWLVNGVHCLKTERTEASFADAFGQVLEGAVALEPLARRAEATVWRDFHLDALLPRIEDVLARASDGPRAGAGSADDAYRLAVLAEKLSDIFFQQPYCV